MEKTKVDGKVSSNGHISHGLASSTGENKTNLQSPKDAEFSSVSSERVHSVQQTSVRSDFRSETGQPPYNAKRKVSDLVTDHNKLLKTDSSSSKESGEVVQLSSVDSTDPIPCQASNNEVFVENYEKKPYLTQSGESKASQDRESSDSMAASLQSPRHCNFDLNDGMEAKGAISVVAKVGVPMGKPKKPLQFGGELGWRRCGSASAFRATSFKLTERDKDTCSDLGFDLNCPATMDSDLPDAEMPLDVAISNPPGRFVLDLNCQSENVDNHHKQGASSFDLNDNPMTEGALKNMYEHSESRPFLRKSVAADTGTAFGGNAAGQTRPPAYWVDLSSMRGFGHVQLQQQPFLVATNPTAEQVQMVVPSGLYIGKINNLSPTFYPPSVLAQLNNQHGAAAISQVPGPVLAAYPGPVHLIEGPQGLNPRACANMRPTFFSNGSIPLVESGSRGVGNAELLIPVRNGLFETREKPVEQVALPASQINYRQMASWN